MCQFYMSQVMSCSFTVHIDELVGLDNKMPNFFLHDTNEVFFGVNTWDLILFKHILSYIFSNYRKSSLCLIVFIIIQVKHIFYMFSIDNSFSLTRLYLSRQTLLQTLCNLSILYILLEIIFSVLVFYRNWSL